MKMNSRYSGEKSNLSSDEGRFSDLRDNKKEKEKEKVVDESTDYDLKLDLKSNYLLDVKEKCNADMEKLTPRQPEYRHVLTCNGVVEVETMEKGSYLIAGYKGVGRGSKGYPAIVVHAGELTAYLETDAPNLSAVNALNKEFIKCSCALHNCSKCKEKFAQLRNILKIKWDELPSTKCSIFDETRKKCVVLVDAGSVSIHDRRMLRHYCGDKLDVIFIGNAAAESFFHIDVYRKEIVPHGSPNIMEFGTTMNPIFFTGYCTCAYSQVITVGRNKGMTLPDDAIELINVMTSSGDI